MHTEDARCINLNEQSSRLRKHGSVFSLELGLAMVLFLVGIQVPALQNQRPGERDRAKEFDFHLPGHRDYVARAAGLAHRFIHQSGDCAAVHVAGWTLKALRRLESAEDSTLAIHQKLQSQPSPVRLPATEAAIRSSVREGPKRASIERFNRGSVRGIHIPIMKGFSDPDFVL